MIQFTTIKGASNMDDRITTLINRVIKWNADRYPRQYDVSLSRNLIAEESGELLKAIADRNTVEVMDALGDITFVIIGAMWKLEIAPNEIKGIIDKSFAGEGTPVAPMCSHEHLDESLFLSHIIANLQITVKTLGLYYADLIDILAIICDSNETKKVDKVDPKVKANIDKGKNFISPSQALTEFVERRCKNIDWEAMVKKIK